MTEGTGDLGRARIALLESRLAGELADLVRRHGGEPVCAPAVRESPRDALGEVAAFIDGVVSSARAVVVFLTGVGAAQLFAEAERLERAPELLAALGRATTVCRGPKPSAALRRRGVQVSVSVPEPYTMTELLDAMAALDLGRSWVGLVHYGERNAALAQALTARGVELHELQLYEWRLPDDVGALRTLVRDIIAGRIDAVAFTSQIQVRHLFRIAVQEACETQLAEALNDRAVVASVGPVCSAVLRGCGVNPQVEPAHPKMRPMVAALADYLARHRRHAS